MTVSKHFIEQIAELLAPLGDIRIRRMFSGGGVYCDGVMLGLIADDTLYLKADAESCKRFEAEGQGPFVTHGRGKPVRMSFWRAPERLHDEPDELQDWARQALAVARRAVRLKSPRLKQ